MASITMYVPVRPTPALKQKKNSFVYQIERALRVEIFKKVEAYNVEIKKVSVV